MSDFTHFDDSGRGRMVDVGGKEVTERRATAAGRVLVNRETFELIATGGMKKGDVLGTAQVAGIMAAKKTSELVPMCHPLMITGVDMDFNLNEEDLAVEIRATVKCRGVTGVEMEALTAVSTAALTVYDMCKAVQKDMVIDRICLLHKSGGKSGDINQEELWNTKQL
ncbi:MAG: cyclic pyranopterin monophosphate synthase MoaC [Clostridiales bacterium]|nr:cyclic pyranopterin monophosphate synthase MoaC [Clostridiales bacterium]MDD7035840.1 cyclic pyranopterin monophosphate synthase MoaC [Bacillota bacterium]